MFFFSPYKSIVGEQGNFSLVIDFFASEKLITGKPSRGSLVKKKFPRQQFTIHRQRKKSLLATDGKSLATDGKFASDGQKFASDGRKVR